MIITLGTDQNWLVSIGTCGAQQSTEYNLHKVKLANCEMLKKLYLLPMVAVVHRNVVRLCNKCHEADLEVISKSVPSHI